MKNEQIYIVWIEPNEHDSFLKDLGNQGFHWNSGALAGEGKSILETVHDPSLATTYSINLLEKTLSYFPLEIYQSGSPTANPKKYDKYKAECISVSEFMKLLG